MSLPPGASTAAIGAVRSALRGIVASSKSVAVRTWLQKHLKVLQGASRAWATNRNVAAVCQAFDGQKFARASPLCLGNACQAQSLRACAGNWLLPILPDHRQVVASIRIELNRWVQRCRLKPLLFSVALHALSLEARLTDGWARPMPLQWMQQQRTVEEEMATHQVLVGDDKNRAKMWGLQPLELHCLIVQQALVGVSNWCVVHDLDPAGLIERCLEMCRLALPSWLRRGRANKGPLPDQGPTLFVSIKSKCYADDGTHICSKVGHSCLRRIIEFSRFPFQGPWRFVARGLRAMLAEVTCGIGVPSLKALPNVIRAKARHLVPSLTGRCMRCGGNLEQWNIATADIDQAFEECGGPILASALTALQAAFQVLHPSGYVSVKKGKAVETHIGRFWSSDFITLHCTQITHAIQEFAKQVCCTFGNTVLQISGLPIGAIPSAAAVEVFLNYSESVFLNHSELQARNGFHFLTLNTLKQHVLWVRYVDDLCFASRTVCAPCLLALSKLIYPTKVSACSGDSTNPHIHIIADVQIIVGPTGLTLLLKNPNRPFLTNGEDRVRVNLIPWPGSMPMRFAQLRGCVLGLIARARQVHDAEYLSAHCVIEFFWELDLLGYPSSLLHALAFSLPASTLAQTLRGFVAKWLAIRQPAPLPMAFMRGKNGGKGYSRDHGRQENRGRYGDRERDSRGPYWEERGGRSPARTHKPSRPRSSSSSSEETRVERKVRKAKSFLERNDKDYAQYLEARRALEERKRVVEQGKILAEALQPTLLAAALGRVPPPDDTPPQQSPRDGEGSHGTSVDADALDAAKRLWLQSEIGVDLHSKGYHALQAELSAMVGKKKVLSSMNQFLTKHGNDGKPPKQSKEVIAAIVKVLRNT